METTTVLTVGIRLQAAFVLTDLRVVVDGVNYSVSTELREGEPYYLVTDDGEERSAFLSWETITLEEEVDREALDRLYRLSDPSTVTAPSHYSIGMGHGWQTIESYKSLSGMYGIWCTRQRKDEPVAVYTLIRLE